MNSNELRSRIVDLINELEHISQGIYADADVEDVIEELECQVGTVKSIIEDLKMKKNKLKISKMGLFSTPASLEVIQEWIESHPKDVQVHLWTAMGMTWNFLSETIDKFNEFGGDSAEHLD